MKEAEVPEGLTVTCIKAFYKKKKENKMDCNNYTGLRITSSVDKLYRQMLKMRTKEETENSEAQSGFYIRRILYRYFVVLNKWHKR